MQPWFLETPPAALLEDINDNTVRTILSPSLFPLPSTEFPIPLLAWHPTDRTAGVGTLWSQRTRRTGRRDREKDGERMKRLEKKDGRSKTKIPWGPMRPEPDSKLEKICSEFLDWDPPEIALSLDPSTHTHTHSLSFFHLYLYLSTYFSFSFKLIWSLSRGLHGTPTRDTSTLWPHRGSSIFHLDLILVFHERSIFGFTGNFRDPTRQRRNNFHLLIGFI